MFLPPGPDHLGDRSLPEQNAVFLEGRRQKRELLVVAYDPGGIRMRGEKRGDFLAAEQQAVLREHQTVPDADDLKIRRF